MSTYDSDYTESTNYTETTEDTETAETTEEKTRDGENGEEEENGEGQKTRKAPTPPPEPEIDPFEGVTYDDNPEEELPEFGNPKYWLEQYTQSVDVMEWYMNASDFLPIIQKNYEIEETTSCLVLGTGTSELAPKLADAGPESVLAIDYVLPLIKKMRRLHRETANLTWKVMDMRKLKFGDATFNLIVDKASLDCVFHVSEKEVDEVMGEISRVLMKKGVFICASTMPPSVYAKHFDRPTELMLKLEKTIEVPKPVPTELPYYVYVVRKISRIKF